MSEVDDFLKNFGLDKADKWSEVIKPASSFLIVGDVGTGKTALAFYLLERFSKELNLSPVVVGLPEDKQELLPEGFCLCSSPEELTRVEDAIVFIDEADLQLPIEDVKARKYVVNFLSLPRHRNQVFLLAFHFPRLVLGRYLPFFSAFLLKRPPYLLDFASKGKGDVLNEMMHKAEERFAEFPSQLDVVKHTYVVAPRIRWQGMLQNPLCSFWTDDLSKVWAGTDICYNKAMGSSPSVRRRAWPISEVAKPEEFKIIPLTDEEGYLVGFRVLDPSEKLLMSRKALIDRLCEEYPKFEQLRAWLEDAAIAYEHYEARVELPEKIFWTPQLKMKLQGE